MSSYSHQTNANLIAEMQRIQTNIETLTAHIQQLNHRQSSVEVHLPSTSAPVLNLDGQELVAFLREQRDKHRHALRDITAELHGRFESEYVEEPSVVDEQTPLSIPTPDTSRKGKTGAAPNIANEPNDGWS